jgi:hypothetical protein
MTVEVSGSTTAAPDQEDATLTRRSIFGIGTAVVAGLATVLARPTEAHADCQGSPCCFLASCTRCRRNPRGGWFCPRGFNARFWTCVSGRRRVICGECARGSNCFQGPWACSIWYFG